MTEPEIKAALALQAVQHMADDVREIKDTLKDMDGRLRSLEQSRGYIAGVAAVLGAAVSFLVSAFLNWLKGAGK